MSTQTQRPITDAPEDMYAPSRGRRQHVLRVLLDAMRPLSVAEVATACGIHLNTARFHLELLVNEGFAERQDEVRKTPGRRKVLYTARPKGQNARRARGFRLLSEMLTLVVVQSVANPEQVALDAGRQWGRDLTPTPSPAASVDAEAAVEQVREEMDALWFAPDVKRVADDYHIELNNCPFLEIAQAHPHVVCRIHSGLISGALEEMGAPAHLHSVTPGNRPHQCLAIVKAGQATGDGELILGHHLRER